MEKTGKDVLKTLKEQGITKIKIGGYDVDGILRGKYISADKFISAVKNGLGFCDVIFGWDCNDDLYDNVSFTGWHTGYPDVQSRIELDSMRLIPWEPGTAFFLLDFFDKEGGPLEISPQQALKRVVHRAHEMGFEPLMSAEFEYFFFQEDMHSVRDKGFRNLKPLSPGMFGYSALRTSMFSDLVGQIIEDMEKFGCPVEGIHTETGPGVYESALKYDTALNAARSAALFKSGMKEIAARHGLIVTFMAKWNTEYPGCSGHIHQSLWNRDRSTNLFAGEAPGEMSEIMKQYVAGMVEALPELTAFYAPTINSYKRLVEGTWAPTNAAWGEENRTTAVRVITGPSSKASRAELRATGSDINPFIACAASLASGLYGIEDRLTLGAPCKANAYDPGQGYPALPRTLSEAVERLRESEIARRYFGDAFVDHYSSSREWEVRQHNQSVSSWELARYFEVV